MIDYFCIQAIAAADAAGEHLQAAMLRDLLHTATPKPELRPADCAPDSPAACREFFEREGFVCLPKLFEGEQLRRMHEAFQCDHRQPSSCL